MQRYIVLFPIYPPGFKHSAIDIFLYETCVFFLDKQTCNTHDVQVCSVDNVELESVVASPEIEVYFYGPISQSNLTATYNKELEVVKLQVKV